MIPMNMPVREYAGGSVGGILRKGPNSAASSTAPSTSGGGGGGDARQVDLLVFGYACKVFRDDAKARDIDQGKHLIPWMGDNTLKIDRYDVRGALFDLSPHEPPAGGYGNRLDYLSADEQRAEQLCEEERYLYLYNNEEELTLQQEEDLKRLQQESNGGGYSQVEFQYATEENAGVQHGPNREDFNAGSPAGSDEPDQAYTVPRNFTVPASVQLPETMKQHAIIEKTARFIATQGVQMEILLKAKQSNNVQFEFLSQNSPLNAYYKHVVNAIKEGNYPAEQPAKDAALDAAESAAIADAEAAAAAATAQRLAKPVIAVPTIKYKPSADCAYTQLISKIKGVPLPDVLDENAKAAAAAATATATAAGDADATAGTTSGSDAGDFTPVLLQYNGNTFVTADPDTPDGDDSNSNSNLKSTTTTTTAAARSISKSPDSPPQVTILKNSSALALAQGYSSGSDDDDTEEADEAKVKTETEPPEPELSCPIPAESLKNIIDKTATYVIKNGRQFEETLRTKSEERFTFLLPDNEYYPYYMYKITGDPDAASKEQKTRKAAAVAAALLTKKGLIADKSQPTVSFTLKPRDESATGAFRPALPQEASDDEDNAERSAPVVMPKCFAPIGDTPAPRLVPEHVQKAIQLVESQLMARNAQIAAAVCAPLLTTCRAPAVAVPVAVSVPVPLAMPVRSRFDVDFVGNSLKTHVKSTKAELERNALYEQQQQIRQKKLKKAEEKVKDKLAQIAREKLGGLITKEKQLQQERKRKAMAFLNHIRGTPPSVDAEADKQVKVEDDDDNASDDSATSVHSIPITSFGPDEHSDDEPEATPGVEPPQLLQLPLPTIATVSLTRIPQALTKTNSSPAIAVAVGDDDNAGAGPGVGGAGGSGGGGGGGSGEKAAGAVEVTDDDDVQLVSESKAPPATRRPNLAAIKSRRSRSRDGHTTTGTSQRRQQRQTERTTSNTSTASSYSTCVTASSLDVSDRLHSSRSRHGAHSSSKPHKSRKSSKHDCRSSRDNKKKSKRHERSRSRSHRRSSSTRRGHRRRVRSRSPISARKQRDKNEKRRSHTPTKRKATKRKYDR